MEDEYKLKVITLRLIFLLIFIGGAILYVFDLDDYLIVLTLLVLIVGIFPMSDADVSIENIKVRKNYFRALVGIRRTIEYVQINSIALKHYSIETHEEAFLYADTVVEALAVDFNRPTVDWTKAKVMYTHRGKTRSIELRMTRGEFRDIERRIK